MKYLKDKQYYIDLYDRLTVDHCRRLEKGDANESETDLELKIRKKWSKVIRDMITYIASGEEYLQKEKTIRKWMLRDEEKDNLFERTELSMDIYCLECGQPMIFELKSFHGHDDQHILFFYRCDKGHKGRAFLETGEEYIPDKPKCSKCGGIFRESSKRKKTKLTIFRHCISCGLDDNYVYDDKKVEEKPDPDYVRDRERFCLTKEKGQKYLQSKLQLENVSRFIEKNKKKEAQKPLYNQLGAIEKLTVVQLKQLLQPNLEKAGYTSLVFSEPKIDRHVIIDFSLEDSKNGRVKYDSKHQLKKLIEKILYNVNWNLMINSPSYRMGVLTGQLKGLEVEEDLLNKIKKRKSFSGC